MKKLIVQKVEFNPDPCPVFDIEVMDDHHYLIEDGIVSHNSGFIFASSIVVSMNKRKLKQDEAGNKISEVAGIRAIIKCVKTRYAKPFEEVEVLIPYKQGLDPYSGLFDLFEKTVLQKDGNRYRYVSNDGTEHKLFRKQMTADFYQMIMREWQDDKPVAGVVQEEETADVE